MYFYCITVIEEWKKREILQERNQLSSIFPTFLTLIAGKIGFKSVVKVFLRKYDDGVEKYLKDVCKVPFEVQISSNASERRESNFETLKKIKENKTSSVLSENEKMTMKDMRKVVQSHEDSLMANHSNLVGIEVSRTILDGSHFGKPYIVLHCLDEKIVPFGESTLPKYVEGYPVDVKETLYTFTFCENCPPVDHYCSIGRGRSCKSAGSVGFFVRNCAVLHEGGFLTAAHVAFPERRLADLYKSRNFFSETDVEQYEIVHPSNVDNAYETDQVHVIGNVNKAFFGNFATPNELKKGIDVAYVKCNIGIQRGIYFC